MITECNLPLSLVESPSFRNVLIYLNRQVEPWLPEDHHTIQNWISRQFDFQKIQVKKHLQRALSCIHITTDLWTSGNDLALLGAIAHFVNSEGDLEEILIALKEVDGAHTGENLSKYILAAINDFDITPQLGYFQMDNASNNDTMIREVSASKLLPLSSAFLTNSNIALPQEYNPRHYRIRCQGHILNLVANAFLQVTDPNQIDNSNNVNITQLEQWRKEGPLGKLHNLCVKIHSSPQLLAKFKVLSKGYILPMDNCTRWGSWHKLIERGLALQGAITQFQELWLEPNNTEILQVEDWDTIQKVYIYNINRNFYINL